MPTRTLIRLPFLAVENDRQSTGRARPRLPPSADERDSAPRRRPSPWPPSAAAARRRPAAEPRRRAAPPRCPGRSTGSSTATRCVARIDGERVRVRLLGVDAPESAGRLRLGRVLRPRGDRRRARSCLPRGAADRPAHRPDPGARGSLRAPAGGGHRRGRAADRQRGRSSPSGSAEVFRGDGRGAAAAGAARGRAAGAGGAASASGRAAAR